MECVVGATVVYSGNGVCKISEISSISFGHERPEKYYVLKPLFVRQDTTFYVPLKNDKLISLIKPVLTKAEALLLMDNIPNISPCWIEERNIRKDEYQSILNGGSREEIISIIKAITLHKRKLSESGKTLNMQDEKLLRDAEHRMNAEFAVALDEDIDDVAIRIDKIILSDSN